MIVLKLLAYVLSPSNFVNNCNTNSKNEPQSSLPILRRFLDQKSENSSLERCRHRTSAKCCVAQSNQKQQNLQPNQDCLFGAS